MGWLHYAPVVNREGIRAIVVVGKRNRLLVRGLEIEETRPNNVPAKLECRELSFAEVVTLFLQYSQDPDCRQWFARYIGIIKDHAKVIAAANGVCDSQFSYTQSFE